MDDSYFFSSRDSPDNSEDEQPSPTTPPPRDPSPSRSHSPSIHSLRSHSPLHGLGKNLGIPSFSSRPTHRRSASADTSSMSDNGNGSSLGAGIQDRLLSRILQGILPSDYSLDAYADRKDKRKDKDRPAFSLTLMSTNFRRFNQRIGVVFIFQHRLFRLLQWKEPTHTLSFLATYTFICLDPFLLFALPPIIALLFLMVPAFITRHPPPPSPFPFPIETESTSTYSGPAVAPPPELKAVSEISKDFFRNLRDLQNSMEDFSVAHDKVIQLVGPPTNFSDERLSSGVFLILLFTSCVMFIAAHTLPWRFIFLLSGWVGVSLCHPFLASLLVSVHTEHLAPREARASKVADSFIHRDITLSTTPTTREVEIFELQKRTDSGEYESWVFGGAPYEPLSRERIAGEKVKGTRFLEDVKAPYGWEWWEGKWSLDLGMGWVEERALVGVRVEGEGERWVWDEGGEWRRRRWVRRVMRKYLQES